MTYDEAFALLRKYNSEPFHITHALTVSNVMRRMADELGYGDEADFWAVVGLLHDIDFERWPTEHCKKCVELLREGGADDRLIHAVVCHGYGGRAECMRHRGKSFYDLEFNILMPNARAHGDSAGDWIGMGWPERKDIIGWIYEIIRRDKDAQILLYGESMGAATVMMTAGEQLPPQVKLAIEDCGYTSVWDQAKAAVKDLYGGAMGVFIPAVSLASKVKFGYSFREASALNQIRRCRIPVLFIHGEADALVPCAMVYRLYEAANCDKQLLTVPGAGHCLSASVAPKLYWSAVRSFIERYIDR